jgi:hypothetical protein
VSPRDVLTLARALYAATTSDDANALLVAAIDDGLSITDAAQAYRDWCRLRARTVITLEATP